MANRYEVLIKGVLDTADVQKQLDKKVKAKPITIKTSLGLDDKSMENQMRRWNNRLKKLKLDHPAAYGAENIQKETKAYRELMVDVRNGKATRDDVNTQWNNTNVAVKDFNKSQKIAIRDGMEMTKMIGLAVKKVAIWAIATSVIYGTFKKIQEGIQYIKDLNKEMTDIQIVTGMNRKQIKGLSNDYNALAQQMGANTLEIAQGSLEWFRQGKTAQEALKLTKESIIMSKLGNIEAAQSTEYLTSTLNGFKLEAKDTMTVIDKLVALDNAYATSVAEISAALQKSSNSAQQAGVTFDELASYITVISSVTRQSGESIGTSLRTMFARMQNIKLGKMFEDEATNINDVEKALSLVDITLRDTEDSFKPMGDVLDEIASKWSTMTETEQSAVATTVAGIRQRENFLVLMNNYNEVLIAQAVELNSAGLALERYEIYINSIEAAANKNTAAMQRMWQATINTDFIKWTVSATTGVMNLVAELGGLVPVLTTVAAILSTVKWTSIVGIGPKIAGMMGSIKALGLALINPYAIAIAVIAAAIGTVIYLSGNLDRAIQKNINSIDEIDASITATESTIAGLGGVIKRIDEISDRFEELRDNTSRTNDEQQEFYDLQAEIKALMPSVSGHYDEQGRFILTESTNLAELNKQKLLEIQIAKDKLALDREQQAILAIEGYELASKEGMKASDIIDAPKGAMGIYSFNTEALQAELQEAENMAASKIRILTSLYLTAQEEGEEAFTSFTQNIIDSGEMGQDILDAVIVQVNQLGKELDNMAKPAEVAASPEALLAQIDIVYQNATAIRDLVHSYDALNGVTASQVQTIQTMFPLRYQEALTVDQNTGLIYLNIEALKNLVAQKGIAAQSSVETAIAIDGENLALLRMRSLAETTSKQISSPSFWAPKATSGVNTLREAQDKYTESLRETLKTIERKKNAEKDALKDQLDGYKKIIDAKKKIIDQEREEDRYQDELADKNRELSDIENELLQIQFDNSDEAKKRRLELEDEKAKKIVEIDEFQTDRSVELQKDALDQEYENYKENIEKKIKAIDDYLETVTIHYNNLIAESQRAALAIGNSISSGYNTATNAVNNFTAATARAIEAQRQLLMGQQGYFAMEEDHKSNYAVFYDGSSLRYKDKESGQYVSETYYKMLPNYHLGGIVGSSSMEENEILATLLKGEVVATEDQAYNFIRNVLPTLLNAGGTGDTVVPVNVTIEGNVDQDVMVDLKTDITKAVYDAMTKRGTVRGVNSFSI